MIPVPASLTPDIHQGILGPTLANWDSGMSKTIYSLYEARTSLSRLVDRAASGEEIILCKGGKPLAKLVPIHPPRLHQPGGWEGQVRIADDFDDPLSPEITMTTTAMRSPHE
jgi:prevent-host-death family protein